VITGADTVPRVRPSREMDCRGADPGNAELRPACRTAVNRPPWMPRSHRIPGSLGRLPPGWRPMCTATGGPWPSSGNAWKESRSMPTSCSNPFVQPAGTILGWPGW